MQRIGGWGSRRPDVRGQGRDKSVPRPLRGAVSCRVEPLRSPELERGAVSGVWSRGRQQAEGQGYFKKDPNPSCTGPQFPQLQSRVG